MLAWSIKETIVAQKNETSSCLHTTVYLEIQCKSSLMKNSSCVHRDLPPGGFARGAASWAQYLEQWVKHNTQSSILSKSSTILSLNTRYSTGQVKSTLVRGSSLQTTLFAALSRAICPVRALFHYIASTLLQYLGGTLLHYITGALLHYIEGAELYGCRKTRATPVIELTAPGLKHQLCRCKRSKRLSCTKEPKPLFDSKLLLDSDMQP